MKTMMDLVISLQRFDEHLRTLSRRRQLSPHEERTARWHLQLVREVIPPEVLAHYDQMKTKSADLLESEELFAISVLVATYATLSPRKRRKFLNHFSPRPCAHCSSNGHAENPAARLQKRFVKTTGRKLVALN